MKGPESDTAQAVTKEEVCEEYLDYCEKTWLGSKSQVCHERSLILKAKHFLKSEPSPQKRFGVLSFYQHVHECVQASDKGCRAVCQALVKAMEVLESYCINLLLFPWRKEFRSLKTFTGPFVYFIQPVLPRNVIHGILDSMGYKPHTDTEFQLCRDIDNEKIKKIGFELFLARQECEYLVEAMDQMKDAECLQLLQTRASNSLAYEDYQQPFTCERPKETSSSFTEAHMTDRAFLEPVDVLQQNDKLMPRSSENMNSELNSLNPCSMSEDKSIADIYSEYPDLAIHQKPIFGEVKKVKNTVIWSDVSAAPGELCSQPESTEPNTNAVFSEFSFTYPNTISDIRPREERKIVTTPTDLKNPKDPEVLTATLPLVSSVSHVEKDPAQDHSNYDEVLPHLFSQMKIEDQRGETMKYPIEETLPPEFEPHDCHRSRHLKDSTLVGVSHSNSPKKLIQSVMCRASSNVICHVKECSSCVKNEPIKRNLYQDGDSLECCTKSDKHNNIKEPPQSFYIPPCLENQSPTTDSERGDFLCLKNSSTDKDIQQSQCDFSPLNDDGFVLV
ncbi:uncharacterized protein LOC120535334 [Polypterus senegalus]